MVILELMDKIQTPNRHTTYSNGTRIKAGFCCFYPYQAQRRF